MMSLQVSCRRRAHRLRLYNVRRPYKLSTPSRLPFRKTEISLREDTKIHIEGLPAMANQSSSVLIVESFVHLPPLLYLIIALVPIATFLVRISYNTRRPKNFPAGPATVPLIGNLHLLPTSKAFLKSHVPKMHCFAASTNQNSDFMNFPKSMATLLA